MLRIRTTRFILGLLIAVLLQSCTGTRTATTTTPKPIPTIDENALAIGKVRQWLDRESTRARSLQASGSISVEQNGSGNSASFVLKSKRLDEAATARIDSFSLEVSGPFGIKVARFLASPEEYELYDILHGEPMYGHTDKRSLEQLTHLNGVSLSMMNDLAYGLAPVGDGYSPLDSLALFSSGTEHSLVIYRVEQNATEAIDLEGDIPDDIPSESANLHVTSYRRWNGHVDNVVGTSRPPAVAIRYSDRTTVNGVSVPQHIEANTGQNSLTLEYSDISVNPSPLMVWIKMPK